ncbi:cathepsin L [Drosophila busckii]|uniref:cathepsin L n=1 Tax=Drosophila busckii TaxID=30019 RepID=UPI00083EAD26|nr:cathepsin L [Drosophila busckii]
MNLLKFIFAALALLLIFALEASAAPATSTAVQTAGEARGTVTGGCFVDAWNGFKHKYKKNYNSDVEEQRRRRIFCRNVQEIVKHNSEFRAQKQSYAKGINEFADLTSAEWEAMYLM